MVSPGTLSRFGSPRRFCLLLFYRLFGQYLPDLFESLYQYGLWGSDGFSLLDAGQTPAARAPYKPLRGSAPKARNPKSETNPKLKFSKFKTKVRW